MKKFIVVAYDIEDDKQRRQVAELLEDIGKRVNRSVFECFITDEKLKVLKKNLKKHVTRHDSILYYMLCRGCIERIERHGTGGISVETALVF